MDQAYTNREERQKAAKSGETHHTDRQRRRIEERRRRNPNPSRRRNLALVRPYYVGTRLWRPWRCALSRGRSCPPRPPSAGRRRHRAPSTAIASRLSLFLIIFVRSPAIVPVTVLGAIRPARYPGLRISWFRDSPRGPDLNFGGNSFIRVSSSFPYSLFCFPPELVVCFKQNFFFHVPILFHSCRGWLK